YRAVAHDGGVAAGHGHAADLGARFQAHGLGLFGAHHQHGGGAVGQRRGGAGGDGAADRVEYRAQFGHVLDAGVGTDHFVDFAQHFVAVGVVAFDRHDFVFPAALFGGFPGFLVGAHAELVLLFTGDAVHAAE